LLFAPWSPEDIATRSDFTSSVFISIKNNPSVLIEDCHFHEDLGPSRVTKILKTPRLQIKYWYVIVKSCEVQRSSYFNCRRDVI